MSKGDYHRFLLSLKEFNRIDPIYSLYLKKQLDERYGEENKKEIKKIVQIIAYNLLPNHFHLLIRQDVDGGLSEFMKRLGGGYTNYFNISRDRSGSLFQGKYKAKRVKPGKDLEYVSCYINSNEKIHGYDNQNQWSSLKYYLGMYGSKICDKRPVMKNFTVNKYQKYLKEVIEEVKLKKDDKNQYL